MAVNVPDIDMHLCEHGFAYNIHIYLISTECNLSHLNSIVSTTQSI